MVARIARAILALTLSGCSLVIGNHPFSSLPQSSGQLDRTPDVLIARGESDVVCGKGDSTELHFFVTLRWMPAQQIIAWTGRVDSNSQRAYMYGSTVSLTVNARGVPASAAYHQVNFLVGGRTYSVTTIVLDCGGG